MILLVSALLHCIELFKSVPWCRKIIFLKIANNAAKSSQPTWVVGKFQASSEAGLNDSKTTIGNNT